MHTPLLMSGKVRLLLETSVPEGYIWCQVLPAVPQHLQSNRGTAAMLGAMLLD